MSFFTDRPTLIKPYDESSEPSTELIFNNDINTSNMKMFCLLIHVFLLIRGNAHKLIILFFLK